MKLDMNDKTGIIFSLSPDFLKNTMPLCIEWLLIGVVAGIVLSFIFFLINKKAPSRLWKLIKGALKYVLEAFRNKLIEDVVLFISVVLVVISIVLLSFGISNPFITTVLNVFCTLTATWLITKKSSEAALKDTMAMTAKKSRRYIDTVNDTIASALKEINDTNSRMDNEADQAIKIAIAKESLRVLDAQVNDIKEWLVNCGADWGDWMTHEDVMKYNMNPNRTDETKDSGSEVRPDKPNIPNSQINSEPSNDEQVKNEA